MFIVIGFLIPSLRNVSSTDFALLEILHEREQNNGLFRREANPLGLFPVPFSFKQNQPFL